MTVHERHALSIYKGQQVCDSIKKHLIYQLIGKWVDRDLEHHHARSRVDRRLGQNIRKRIGIVHRKGNHQNIGIDQKVHLIHHQVTTNHRPNIRANERNMTRDHRYRTEAEDIVDLQVRQTLPVEAIA